MIEESYADSWSRVDSLDNQGLPRSASAVVEEIYADAVRDDNEAHLIKSLIYRAKYRYALEDDSINEVVAVLEEHTRSASPPAAAILHSVLGDVLWSHLQANRYLYYGRTSVAREAQRDDDILTWDLSRLVEEALTHYRASLSDRDLLLATPVDTFDLLLIEEPESRRFRPSLFDMLAHRALDVLENTESGLTQPEQPYVVDAEALLVPAADFATIDFAPADSLSLDAEALRIHQHLVRAHLNDVRRDALVHANLRRLRFVREHGLGVNGELYLEALVSFADQFGTDSLVAYIDLARANELYRQGQSYNPAQSDEHKWRLREAGELCRTVEAAWPGTAPAASCAQMGKSILQEDIALVSDGVVIPDRVSLIRIGFRNTPTLYVRVYRVGKGEARTWFVNQRTTDAYVDTLIETATPVESTEYALPVDGDHQTHSTEVILPALETGAYVIVGGNSADLNRITATRFVGQVLASRLSFFNRTNADGSIALHVVDRETGKPIAGAEVTPLRVTGRVDQAPTRLPVLTTDVAGLVTIHAPARENLKVEISRGEDWLVSESPLYSWGGFGRDTTTRPETRFFTDRAIYRPGQRIYFKGILLQREGDHYTIRKGVSTTVRLLDVNGREVAGAALRSNEFGTVSGQFTAPTGGLTGVMSITNEDGSAHISVEEYKRPRFEATLEPLEGSAALGDSLMVRGIAVTFAGAPAGGARVRYRVQRTAYFPWYHGWRSSYFPVSNAAEIAHGVVETNADGSFELSFVARPDPDLGAASLPVYNFVISADVTDLAGETQSATTTVRIGERSLVLGLATGDVIDRSSLDSLRVTATTLDGNPVEASGTLRLSKLVEPEAVLRPHWPVVDTVSISEADWREAFPHLAYPGTENPETWEVEREVVNTTFRSAEGPAASIPAVGADAWPTGMYRVELVADDDQGREVRAVSHIRVIDSSGTQVPGTVPSWFHLVTETVEPGDDAVVIFGSSEEDVSVLVESEVRGEIVESRWEEVSAEQKSVTVPIVEGHRGNIAIHATMVLHGNFLGHSAVIRVPYANKELDLRWETFRDKLEPGQEEAWRLRIRGPKGEAVAAELVATLYDASLDQFIPHSWELSVWPSYGSRRGWNGGDLNRSVQFRRYTEQRPDIYAEERWTFDALNLFGLTDYSGRWFQPMARVGAKVEFEMGLVETDAVVSAQDERVAGEGGPPADAGTEESPPPLPPPLRSNFDETAFFLPALRTNAEGETLLEFTMPESLTRWRFMGLAHTQELEVGRIEAETVTQRELMITTNAPRFLRQGDEITFTAAVDNLTETSIDGTAGLRLTNALTAEPLNIEIRSTDVAAVRADRIPFRVAPESGTSVAWTFAVPDGVDAIAYHVDATSPGFADGEESVLPVLTNRMLVTESLPLPMRGPGEQDFVFERLLNADSPTLRHERVTVEYTANPVWYAVQALPYMMEYPHECAEQVFARLYANGIATYLVDANPRIQEIFDEWISEGAPSLLSNLERNQELKALLIEETPWVRQAKDESDRKRRIAMLFDLAKMRGELASTVEKLSQLQLGDGSWPWFAGMRSDRFITQHIVKGIGTMRRMGVLELMDDARPLELARAGVSYIDTQLARDYEDLVERGANMEEQNISQLQIHALYARSFFDDVAVVGDHQKARKYFMGQVAQFGLEFSVYGQGMAAIVLHRDGNAARALEIIASLRENARQSDELGMYWSVERGWWWYQAPVETQALLIEAFHEVADDESSVEAMQLWLLKQKQTQDWRTTRATTDAVYALLQRGPRLIDEPGSVTVTVGDDQVSTTGPGAEAGTGYITASWSGEAVDQEMGNVTVTKVGPGPAWGAVYWQYFEDLDRITPAETPLRVEKELYVQRNTAAGPELEPLSESLSLRPGDLVQVRVIIRTDRDMEYIHLKDMRASGFEPVNVLSGFRWKDGLGYYESTRDASTNFFISYLARGTYVFEYPLRVRHAGEFSNGITSIQSMYAPEFGAHSRGSRVEVEGE